MKILETLFGMTMWTAAVFLTFYCLFSNTP
ncbi:Uncharacterised protein [Moraxella caviae]|uniref:Uncharacterized protein n=1 Tax=Moraxella caviae TaxID=34060 RepID=A0A378R8S0_9GAMM|nr:Uncharacterised protein [Moraxella caviae]STZ14476.1 Uncharacterised protein [Moraxella caviae]VEW12854.1 Uncharacterised protein [Moraxella caviae]